MMIIYSNIQAISPNPLNNKIHFAVFSVFMCAVSV